MSAIEPRGSADMRRLPLYEADAIEVPFAIRGWYEALLTETVWAEHSHPTHELLWVDSGAFTTMIGAKVWTLTTSLGLWIPAGLRHSGWAAAGVVLRAAQFSVRSSPVLAEGAVAIEFTALLRLLLDRLDGELADGERARTEAVVIDVLRPAEHGFLLRMPRSPLLARIVEAITADPADRTGLEQWSARLGVSSRTITRTFRAETGLGFERWVAAARIRHAIVLLSQGEMVEDVAESVGYRSATAFGAAFRRITGVTPGAVRAD